ncbi:MAG TPA: hypothetical protein VFV72_12285 [Candidatus Limnocylindrales bacterium]|nr:hypothetical protein [Candidatus Limnocylindrales bacterium]
MKPLDFLRAQPFATWLDDTTLLLTAFDGHKATIRAIDVSSDAETTWYEGPNPIASLVADPRSRAVYVSFVDAATRSDLGIWVLGGQGENPRELVPGRADLVDDPEFSWSRRLWLTPDRSRVVVLDCGSTCEAWVIDTAAGGPRSLQIGLPKSAVIGIDDHNLYGEFLCPQSTCAISALNLATGALTSLNVSRCGSGPASIVSSEPLTVLVTTSIPTNACAQRSTVALVEPNGGRSQTVWSVKGPVDRVPQPIEPTSRFGFRLPSGFFLVGPAGERSTDGQTQLVSIEGLPGIPVFVD